MGDPDQSHQTNPPVMPGDDVAHVPQWVKREDARSRVDDRASTAHGIGLVMRLAVPLVALAIAAIGQALAATPVLAQQVSQPAAQSWETRLRGLDADEAAALIDQLKQAQDGLRRGDTLHFDLLAGAPASYPMTMTSPREAFLSVDFSHPFTVERVSPADSPRKTYRMAVLPNGVGALYWDVRVVPGFNGTLERVEMVYRAPAPF
tara:strand:+ start:1376 stop:1990 length:615 start_codon:yes stop_codon:yes gene_type:complete